MDPYSVACAWKGDDIVVGDVTISPPYCLEDVKGPKDNVDRICSWVFVVSLELMVR